MRRIAIGVLVGAAMTAVTAACSAQETKTMSAEESAALIEAVRANQQLEAKAAPEGGWADGSVYPITMDGLLGGQVPMSAFEGKAVLLVNTASKCGYTPQYEGLQALYEAKKDEGLVVVGVPSGDFMGQEFGEAEDIAEFCALNFGVTFPMAAKDHVKGDEAGEIYKWAEAHLGEAAVPKWNFHKVLIGKDGMAKAAFPTKTAPDAPELAQAIDAELNS